MFKIRIFKATPATLQKHNVISIPKVVYIVLVVNDQLKESGWTFRQNFDNIS